MILIVSGSVHARECARAVEKETGERVQLSTTLRQCASTLQSEDFSAVVIDQVLLDSSASPVDLFWKYAGTATLVNINFAISGSGRVVREVRAALTRAAIERALAAKAAEACLRSELTGAVAGILLSSELALAQPELPVSVASKLKSVHELALLLKMRLGPAA